MSKGGPMVANLITDNATLYAENQQLRGRTERAESAMQEMIQVGARADAENARLRAALEPFAGVARWAERNGHDLLKGWDMLLRQPDGGFAGHLQVQSPDFIAALAALNQQKTDVAENTK